MEEDTDSPQEVETRGRGRPAFKPTAKMRRQVSIAAGSGKMSGQQIAEALGVSRATLYRHFEEELSVGAYQRRLEILEVLFMSAKKGNTAAAKVYLAEEPPMAIPPLPVEPAADEPKTQEKPLGKREQAQKDALTAQLDTPWEGLLTPGIPPPIQ